MILYSHDDQLRVVTQPDHARLAADILGLWRDPLLLENPRRSVILRATAEHDNGWQETDSAPRVDPANGQPFAFDRLPWDVKSETWLRGCNRHRLSDPHLALLITRHSLALLEFHSGEGSYLRDLLENRIEELCEDSSYPRDDLELDYRWLGLADRISLRLCQGAAGVDRVGDWTLAGHGTETTVEPFPLAGATRFRVASRSIPRRRYDSDTDLAMSLAEARWSRTEFRLCPP
ncbi:MAG: DUF3891 family protein [Thermoanaerobaculia bacterium]|nr:DUF3891 family protein [Thermoanaerobaculia bacterium]